MPQSSQNRLLAVLCFSLCALNLLANADTLPSPRSVVQDMLAQVDSQGWYDTVEALVLNEDLDRPGHFFHSRYALRVRETVQHDGSPAPDHASDNAADYIAREFASYGLAVEFDTFSHRRLSLSGAQGDYLMRNVTATLPGHGPHAERIYLVTGHYDSIASKTDEWEGNWRTLPAPGATDNGSGVAQMLQIAEIVSAHEFDFTIEFVAFGGEELGLFGSKHYAEAAASQGKQIAGVINIDQLGHDPDGNLDIHVVANPESAWLMHAFETAHQIYGIDVELVLVVEPEFVYSDHAPFWEIGVNAVMVAEESSFESPEWSEHWHSPEDTLDKLSLPLGERAIELALATLAELAGPMTENFTGLPDLAVVGIAGPDRAQLGESIPAEARVTNASDFTVTVPLLVELIPPVGEPIELLRQDLTLEAQETRAFLLDAEPSGWGPHLIRVAVNPGATLFESDFTNNQAELEIAVAGETQISHAAIFPNPFRLDQDELALRIRYDLAANAEVEIQLHNLLGQPVMEMSLFLGEEGTRLGPNELVIWDGINAHGRRVAPGIYFCTVRARGEDGQEAHRVLQVAVQ